jgi:hypothetical protein
VGVQSVALRQLPLFGRCGSARQILVLARHRNALRADRDLDDIADKLISEFRRGFLQPGVAQEADVSRPGDGI